MYVNVYLYAYGNFSKWKLKLEHLTPTPVIFFKQKSSAKCWRTEKRTKQLPEDTGRLVGLLITPATTILVARKSDGWTPRSGEVCKKPESQDHHTPGSYKPHRRIKT